MPNYDKGCHLYIHTNNNLKNRRLNMEDLRYIKSDLKTKIINPEKENQQNGHF